MGGAVTCSHQGSAGSNGPLAGGKLAAVGVTETIRANWGLRHLLLGRWVLAFYFSGFYTWKLHLVTFISTGLFSLLCYGILYGVPTVGTYLGRLAPSIPYCIHLFVGHNQAVSQASSV
ncbi:hypothetical protein BO71DRAFT_249780 [Aspergillus ellipticus CBS 707.79]|uniref:Uncharacterized protein n=1 Tax=Aspergillus ellipticus CBS 707.79 TaxID=1448320 RepID=A0A319ES29_9EURO|nr:hypothetical protein BO71DRAFT_249780 [Aspergillus ellipticus CBS 707.79]